MLRNKSVEQCCMASHMGILSTSYFLFQDSASEVSLKEKNIYIYEYI